MQSSFWKAGHGPTLFAAFLYFDLSFMVWVMLGPLAIVIAQDLALTAAQKGLMVATPILSGALLRVVMGIMVDRMKPKRAGAIGQLIVIIALVGAWMLGIHTFEQVLVLGIFLGAAGASFAAALPLASRWYPPEHQGKALGIAGAGNSGTVLAALFAPSLANWCGWANVFGLAAIPLAITFAVYMMLAKDNPQCPPAKPLTQYFQVLKDKDAWWFMFFYSVTFGGFVGLAASLVIYFNDQYGLNAVIAGYFTAACVFAGSLVRPLGGMFADRVGGIYSLLMMYTVAVLCLFFASFGPGNVYLALALFVAAMLALGMGNGAVFQLVPQRFNGEIGVTTGLVGMAGGVGGFYLASSLGYSKQVTGGYQMGLLMFASLAIIAVVGLSFVKGRWRATWGAVDMIRAKI